MSADTHSGVPILRLRTAALPVLALMSFLALPGLATAQCSTSGNAPCAGAMLTTYYNTFAPPNGLADNTVELINPVGSAAASGNLPVVNVCAMIYTFDSNENMGECCGCLVTPQGLLTLSVRNNLTSNWIVPGGRPIAGAIDVVSASTNGGNAGSCNAATAYTLSPALNGYITHSVDNAELQFANAGDPSSAAQNSLVSRCAALQGNATGAGICSCNPQVINPL